MTKTKYSKTTRSGSGRKLRAGTKRTPGARQQSSLKNKKH